MRARVTIVLFLLLLGAPSVHAEDSAPKGKGKGKEKPAPPELLQDLSEMMTAERDPVNPIDYLRSYRDWIRQHETPPARTANVHAQHDLWSGALKPKARRMTKRVEMLMKRKYWVPARGTPERVKPEAWSRFTREIAGLGTELHGAWKQYGRANPRPKSYGFGFVRFPRPPRLGAYYGYPYRAVPMSAWRNGLARRSSIGVGGLEMRSYYNLMWGYNRAWEWSMWRRAEYNRRRQELIRKQREFIESEREAARVVRDTLEQQMISLQVLTAAMQAAEEHALREEIEKLPEGDVLRELAEEVVDTLKEARLTAEQYQGTSSAEYGTLIRKWVRAYKAGHTLLRKKVKELAKEEEAREADQGE